MSQYPSLPPPGPYVPPTGGSQSNQSQGFNSQQQQPYGQAQASSPYQSSSTPGYGPPVPSNKPLSQMNQMFNQAVTTGKPMLNKLGKTISSKLGSKHSGPSTPQHLENYQNYQQHYQQTPGQGYPNQPPQQPQSQNAYPTPPTQSNYSTPLGSTHSGQNNYFSTQGAQSPNSQQQPNAPAYNPNQFEFGQSGNVGAPQPGQPQEGQFNQGQYNQGQPQQGHTQQGQFNHDQYNQGQLQQPGVQPGQPPQGQFGQDQFGQGQQHGQPPQGQFNQDQYSQGQPQGPPPQGHYSQDQYNQSQFQQQGGQPPQGQFGHDQYNQGQPPQTGLPDNSQNQGQHSGFQAPYPGSPDPSAQPGQQNQWSSPPLQQQQTFHQNTPPPQQQYNGAPALPTHPSQQQQQTSNQTLPPQSAPSPPIHPNQPQSQQQQQWAPMSPVSPHAQTADPIQPPVSPPPGQQQAQSPPPPNQHVAPQDVKKTDSQSAPTEFIAELPADLGNMTITETAKPPGQVSPYQAYQPSGVSPTRTPSAGFTIPRRAVSISSRPVADPWRWVDPVTEQPTYEFYIIADLLFDAMDKQLEPKNTGMLEGSKIVGSWKELNEDARRVYTYNGYNALAIHWSHLKIPHIMVPVQSDMRLLSIVDQNAQGQEIKIPTEPCTDDTPSTSYMPAINRAGWYKFFLINTLQDPKDTAKSLADWCQDTYKPGVLNHPDMAKRDTTPIPLETRATEVNNAAIKRAFKDIRAEMQMRPDPTAAFTQSGGKDMTAAEMAVQMHKIQMERQFNDMAVRTVLGSGITFGGGGGYSGGYGSLV